MMQINEIQQRFNRIQQSINQAAQACQADGSVPQDLKDTLSDMYEQSRHTRDVLQSQDQMQIMESVDELEELSDQAQRAVMRADDVNEEIKNAVMQAHNELSSLKHQIH